MKEFSHPDNNEKAPADLNAAIANTLTIARNEYKYVADVETDFADLPPIRCHIGALNQVFLNLLVNAAHAIGDATEKRGKRGVIRVRTRLEPEHVRIEIEDTGSGIPEAVRGRIFEPFFTTKEVGKGTGQGLTLAHGIVVKRHNGTLTFESEEGKGTTFFVRLPLCDSPSSDSDLPVAKA
jgi:signal transduction histidine kinase